MAGKNTSLGDFVSGGVSFGRGVNPLFIIGAILIALIVIAK